MFPSSDSNLRHSPSLHRVLSGKFPRFLSTMRMLRNLPLFLLQFVSFSSTVPLYTLFLRGLCLRISSRVRSESREARSFYLFPQQEPVSGSEQIFPGSWGILMRLPCSSTPDGLRIPGLSSIAVLPPQSIQRRLRQRTFEAQSHSFRTRCLRFTM